MKAVKANKVYSINESEKTAYLAQGYDITDDKGKLIERSPTAAVSRAVHDKVLAENAALKAELDKLRADKKSANKNE